MKKQDNKTAVGYLRVSSKGPVRGHGFNKQREEIRRYAEKHGYQILYKTFEEHRRALLAPSWKYTLNYQTQWMNRDELVDVTYEAAQELNQLKLEYGLLDAKEAKRIATRIAKERKLINEIDYLYTLQDEQRKEERLQRLMHLFDTTGPSTICKKDEMNWPLIWINPFKAIQGIFCKNKELQNEEPSPKTT